MTKEEFINKYNHVFSVTAKWSNITIDEAAQRTIDYFKNNRPDMDDEMILDALEVE